MTQSQSDRAIPHDELAELVHEFTPADATHAFDTFESAMRDARAWAAQGERRAVLVTGSITLVGEAMALSAAEGWKR